MTFLDKNVRPDVRAHPRLLADAVLHADAVKTASVRARDRADARGHASRGHGPARTRGHGGG
jgi:hypothetical protein